ncbi:MAG TPA: Lrp/AsnC family transcriptional regulator [Bryobacteraceae bacterium]|jgi:Lrp/AsnC family leucine-responsive transcriptional regulator
MKNALEIARLLDPIGWRILAELQEDARIQYAELGRRVGLSNPAVIERVRRMEEAGIITAYRAEIDNRKVGLPVCAFIRVRVIGNLIPRVIAVAKEMPEVYECHRIAGEDTFLLKVCVPTSEALEKTVDKLTPYVATTTMLVFSSPVTRRAVEPPAEIEASPAQRSKAKKRAPKR